MALGLVGVAVALGWLAVKWRERKMPLAERIDAILPQTQCEKCGYRGCKPYAEAIARGEADINQCPPGGAAGIQQLARLLGREPKPLSVSHGVERPRTVAVIDEKLCIGCTLCIQACPVDAIIGASKQMHTVITALCTGCDLCVAPCPVDCIDMVPAADSRTPYPVFWAQPAGMTPVARAARERHALRLQRTQREQQERAARLAAKADRESTAVSDTGVDAKRALIAAAMERARAQRAAAEPRNTQTLSTEQQEQIARI
jgi:Na+-translocating ferredoxin:NAD+ oxidoreductase subunit B